MHARVPLRHIFRSRLPGRDLPGAVPSNAGRAHAGQSDVEGSNAARSRAARPATAPLPSIVTLTALLLAAVGALAAGCAGKTAKAPPAPPPVTVPVPPGRPMPANDRDLLAEIKKTGLEAEAVEDGLLIYLPTLYLFEFDRAELDPDTQRRVQEIATLLDSPAAAGRRLIVEGHTDAKGTREYNQRLSERRADAVIEELAKAGVARARIARRAFGKDKPLAPNRNPDGSDNPEGRAKNRRVALLIENPPADPAQKPSAAKP